MKLYGGMDSEGPRGSQGGFPGRPADESPVRILLATDAASEGIDLQNHCHRLVHFEIPWNPNRLEQRNGRIDRHGQQCGRGSTTSSAQGYDGAGAGRTTADALEADLEFLMRAARKVNQIREDLGKVGPVIAQQVEEAMLGKRTHLDTRASEEQAEPIRRLLKAERDVQDQIRKLQAQLEEIKTELRLSPENVKHVVDVGLELAQQPPREPVTVDGFTAWRMPALRGAWSFCCRAWRTRTAAPCAPSCSTMAGSRGGMTWCWSTSTTGWWQMRCACCAPRSGPRGWKRASPASRRASSRMGSSARRPVVYGRLPVLVSPTRSFTKTSSRREAAGRRAASAGWA